MFVQNKGVRFRGAGVPRNVLAGAIRYVEVVGEMTHALLMGLGWHSTMMCWRAIGAT